MSDETERVHAAVSLPYVADPAIARAIGALVSICPTHVHEGVAYVGPDCGDCGSRQDATRIYLLGVIEDARKALGL